MRDRFKSANMIIKQAMNVLFCKNEAKGRVVIKIGQRDVAFTESVYQKVEFALR